MNILKIYEKYQIPQILQEHQLRVAAVGNMIYGHLQGEIKNQVDKETLITALLLHDIGNLAKFNLEHSMIEDKSRDWIAVQKEFWKKFGKVSRIATQKIVQDIQVNNSVLNLVDFIGMSKAEEVLFKTMTEKIATYSDQRVQPYSVGTLEERKKEGTVRFKQREPYLSWNKAEREEGEKLIERSFIALHKIEKQIFSKTDISPEFITDKSIQPYFEKLKSYNIKTQ